MNENINTAKDPFGLSELPTPDVPGQAWSAIESALQNRQRVRKRFYWLASAAAVMLAVGIYWQLPQLKNSDQTLGSFTEPVLVENQPAENASIDSLVRLSQRLERNLRVLRREVDVMSGQALIFQVELEDLVAQVDEAINWQPDSKALWAQRVNLLQDLNQLYQQQLRRDVSQYASL